jgi:phosphatidylserine/phosphatidylglycerophosphate/cardiolipin synthase-like enzyme
MAGGAALGFVYSYLAEKEDDRTDKWRILSVKSAAFLISVIVLALVSLWLLRPFLTQLSNVFAERDANLSEVLISKTVSTHWFDPAVIETGGEGGTQLALAAAGMHVALAWVEHTTNASLVVTQSGMWEEHGQGVEWTAPRTIYKGSARTSGPQAAISADGSMLHFAWRDGAELFYSHCSDGSCTDPLTLTESVVGACPVSEIDVSAAVPTLAVGVDKSVMIVYHAANGGLRYNILAGDDQLASGARGCIQAIDTGGASQLKLAARPDGGFSLAFTKGPDPGQIALLEYSGGSWSDKALVVGSGHSPAVIVDAQGELHLTWCGAGAGVTYWTAGAGELLTTLPCLSRPEVAQDSHKRLHITWFSDEVASNLGQPRQVPVIYEAVGSTGSWSEPAIVSGVRETAQLAQVGDDGILHLAWAETAEPGGIRYTSQAQYHCPDEPQGRLAQIAFAVAQQTNYQPAGDPVPYCGNRYDRLLFTPSPPPASSSLPKPNAGFDDLAELIAGAEYEVLLSTMDYDEDKNDDSPGSVIAGSVAELYRQLAANPQRYPRGLTVRILLGNPPSLGTLELNSHLWDLLSDLRDAGVPEMINEDLGWRLEVANYEGAWPHSHAKILVVDGKTVVAAGFNMQYTHLPPEHPSGEGEGTVDLALQVSGPVAQDGQLAFDDLWLGSVRRYCSDLNPSVIPWRITCRDSQATSDHVPEVMRYYLPGGEGTALSMLRTVAHDKADKQTMAALAAAEERIDIMHVQFTLPIICNLNYLLDVCDARHAPPYINSMLNAVEENDAQLRLLLNLKPFKGIENAIALGIMQEAVEARGLADRIEVRSFTSPVHAKGTLIDDEFVIVGSQNYHWSAFGENSGLAEYSLGTSDPKAIAEFQRFFDYHWGNTAPMPGIE